MSRELFIVLFGAALPLVAVWLAGKANAWARRRRFVRASREVYRG